MKPMVIAYLVSVSLFFSPLMSITHSQSNSDQIYFSTFLGGVNSDRVSGIVQDQLSNFIATGHTNSPDFPLFSAFDTTFNKLDAFVTKFTESGEIIWSTYLGGSESDIARAIALDNNDEIVISGLTYSNDFPMTEDHDSTFAGGERCECDAFISKISNDGELLWSTYLGGYGNEDGLDIAIDNQNNIIVTGSTGSMDFPTMNAYNSTFGGFWDVFISKFSSTGEMLWSTFYGGDRLDRAFDLAIDTSDNILLGGRTSSQNLPMINSYQNFSSDGDEGFIAKFSWSGNLMWSTYLGGSFPEEIFGIDTYQSDVFVTGVANYVSFPTYNSEIYSGGIADVFLTRFSSNGGMVWSSVFGGSESDFVADLQVSNNGIIITGQTFSTDFGPNNVNMSKTTLGGSDNFVSKFSLDGESIWSITFGGSFGEEPYGMTLDNNDDIIIVGETLSTDFPLFNSVDTSLADNEGFATKIGKDGSFPYINSFTASSRLKIESISFSILISGLITLIIFHTPKRLISFNKNTKPL